VDLLASALLTYLLHSTLLLSAALAARLALRERRLALQEALLHAALVGGLLTAGVQVGLGVRPAGGVWTLAPVAEHGSPTAAAGAAPAAHARLAPPATAAFAPFGLEPSRLALERDGPSADAVRAAPLALPPWHVPLAALWAVLAGIALARLGLGAVRLRRLLRDRQPLSQPERTWPQARRRLGARIEVLAARLGLPPTVRVSTAELLTVPLATGLRRPEVVLPPRVIDELPLDEQTALCAHELAHVARRDPAWLLLARLIEALAPVQPLNLWARRRLEDLAECLSDDLAVRASGRPLGLARSLVDVASWTHPGFTPVTATGAQGARSRLGHRVERLMDPVRALERPGRLVLPLAGVFVLATALVTPVVSSGEGSPASRSVRGPQGEPPAPPAVPDVPAVPAAPPAGPALGAPPAPPVAPVAPAPPPAPQRDDEDPADADVERRIERITRRIEERAQRHAAESARIEAEMEALSAKLKPREQDLERLGRELETAAREMAQAVLETNREGEASERDTAARAHLRQLQDQMRAVAESMRIPHDELRRLSEQAGSIAAAVRPDDEELAELRRLSRELARKSMPDAAQIARLTREAQREVREELRRAAEEMKRAAEEMRRAQGRRSATSRDSRRRLQATC
jgi:beta-lactamase regulating signal transducer with metallopeptidase domain